MFTDNFFKYQRIIIGAIILGLIIVNCIDKNFSHYVVTVSTLNVRDCPSTECQIIDKLKRSETIEVVDYSLEEDTWIKIKTKNSIGFISKKYIEKKSFLSAIGEVERIIFLIVGLIIILFVSFGIPFLFVREILNSMGFENNHAIMFLVGIGILGMINFLTSPISLTIITVIGLVYFLAVALIDGYFLNEMIKMKVEIFLLRTPNYYSFMILKVLGYVGIAFGIYQFVIGISNTDWRSFEFNAFYESMNNSSSNNWIENTVFRENTSVKYLSFFKALVINIGSPVFGIITNFFAPWAIITTAISFVRLK